MDDILFTAIGGWLTNSYNIVWVFNDFIDNL